MVGFPVRSLSPLDCGWPEGAGTVNHPVRFTVFSGVGVTSTLDSSVRLYNSPFAADST